MTNRRDFLKNTTLLAAGGLLAGRVMTSCTETAKAAHKNFGLQLYSLTVGEMRGDKEFSTDVPGGLQRIGEMGYATLELAGYNIEGRVGAVDIKEFNKMAQDAGLKIISTHVGAPVREFTRDNLEQCKEYWKKAFDDHASIGCKYLIQPGQPVTRTTEEVAFVGEALNEAGKIAKAAGMIYGYHNHSGEFVRVAPEGTEVPQGGGMFRRMPEGSKIIQDALIEATDPSLVIFELDVYWTVMGQADPVAYMRKYADRIRMLHIKDFAVLGESGAMNFQKIFEVGYENGITEYIVELENVDSGTQFEGVKGCADYLLNAPFVK